MGRQLEPQGCTGAKSCERILKMPRVSAFRDANLAGQGFVDLDEEAKSRYALPLRFTPATGTILVAIGLLLQSPIWLGSLALLALTGALFPSGMVIDMVYNLGVRHLFHASRLPPMPSPRRFSYLLAHRARRPGA